jgi:hypothetical protein
VYASEDRPQGQGRSVLTIFEVIVDRQIGVVFVYALSTLVTKIFTVKIVNLV